MKSRGDAGDFTRKLARARALAPTEATAGALAFTAAVLEYQSSRATDLGVRDAATRVAATAVDNRLSQRYPLLELGAAVDPIGAELEGVVAALAPIAPGPLGDEGRALVAATGAEQTSAVEAWLDDAALIGPRRGLWIRVAAAPVLEGAAARVEPPTKEEWSGRACPLCGDNPHCSVIVEESGGFLQGSPRYLVCARCAAWWAWPRAVCPSCGEDDSRRLGAYAGTEQPWARIDACDTCRGYIKTFDLRAQGALGVVPAVDDVGTLALDVWSHEKGLVRPTASFAGV